MFVSSLVLFLSTTTTTALYMLPFAPGNPRRRRRRGQCPTVASSNTPTTPTCSQLDTSNQLALQYRTYRPCKHAAYARTAHALWLPTTHGAIAVDIPGGWQRIGQPGAPHAVSREGNPLSKKSARYTRATEHRSTRPDGGEYPSGNDLSSTHSLR
ncbi:hypothetical protein PLICRDRAFT_170164 [Plicaturopsis crispa FD-325 SS-3]|nr:hypothetical protein PLICRDRAFT_170164 [Plicaturopsis crispa FD-325 SS-3]